ncbi:thymidine kinase, cytosolic-like [Uloborus diversus]|uniref:thymidine kinase, cytosolic-like n=1 Tax=Uloborus diversus TaxID=327109 RepID=UPI00240A35BF|nr:thymidine kinase, cytosolic-like [Uloborus diversus]
MLHFGTDSPKIVSPSLSKGHIQIIFGPMFSGKTTELIRRLQRYQIANHVCLIVKYAHDSRYSSTGIATHDKKTLDAVSATTLSTLIADAQKYSVVGIDEGQFFPDTVSFAEEMANRGKIVIVAALDGTYQREGFGDILNLVPLAESVIKLTSVCMVCFENASYTKRIGSETQLEIIGGTEKYMAVCRSCYKFSSLEVSKNKTLDSNVLSDISNISKNQVIDC